VCRYLLVDTLALIVCIITFCTASTEHGGLYRH